MKQQKLSIEQQYEEALDQIQELLFENLRLEEENKTLRRETRVLKDYCARRITQTAIASSTGDPK